MSKVKQGHKITVQGYSQEFLVLRVKPAPQWLVRVRELRGSNEFEFPWYKIHKITNQNG
jgi:hypothetical protein